MRLYAPKKTRQDSVAENIALFLKILLDYVICIYLVLLLVVLPFYNTEGYVKIGTDKADFFDNISIFAGKVILLPLAVYLMLELIVLIKNRKTEPPLQKIWSTSALPDVFALIYGAALIVSFLSSSFRDEALRGTQGWYMGFYPQLTLILIYFLVSRFWEPRKWIFYLLLSASAVVFFMGIVNRYGSYPFGIESAGEYYISTIGNINWYCGYAVIATFVGMALLWQKDGLKNWQRVLLMAYTSLSGVSLILQGSDSGMVTLAVMLIVMFCMSVRDADRMLVFWQEMLLLWGACLINYPAQRFFPYCNATYTSDIARKLTYGSLPVVLTLLSVLGLFCVSLTKRKGKYPVRLFRAAAVVGVVCSVAAVLAVLGMAAVNTIHPGSLGSLSEHSIFTFNRRWGSNRLGTWSFGLRCFWEQNLWHKLFGVGPDCMWAFMESGAAPELLAEAQDMFGNARLTNAHNEWITVLANTGIVGLIGFAGMIVCLIRQFLRKGKRNALVFACGISLLAYTINNIFSFQQSMNVSTMFVILGMGEAFLREEREKAA